MNIVLISTYELGRQPFGLASPTAWLRKRGHKVVSLDLARQSLDEAAIRGAELTAVYLPMHTATRLAGQLIPSLRKQNPGAHLCCYGLYAPMNVEYLRGLGVSTILGGEFEEGLVHLAERLARRKEQKTEPQAEPLIFFRIVSRDIVLEDIRCQVAAGAQHISFGDPDFFNGIRHAMELAEAFHREFPAVTYDATIKIEHLLKYKQHLPTLRDTGCLFVISAVESVDDAVLGFLDKGHTREDFLRVVKTFRQLGMTLHPTFVPFTPWTTLEGYLDLLCVLEEQSVIENVAPVQLGIRLLIPEGSRLLELQEVRRMVGPFDPQSLVYPWKNVDQRLDVLSETVQEIAAAAERQKQSRTATFERIWKAAHAVAGIPAPALASAQVAKSSVPFLSEPWYCCAEPTRDQLVSIGGIKSLAKNAVASVGGFV